MRLMEEYTQCQPHQDLNSFNNSMVHLIELINANLNDPDRDVQELASLQSKVDHMLESVQKLVKAKSERIVEEIIPNYFINLSSSSVSASPAIGENKKRKLVTFHVEDGMENQEDTEMTAGNTSSWDTFDIDNMANEDIDSLACLPVNTEYRDQLAQGDVVVSQPTYGQEIMQYRSYYTQPPPPTTTMPLQLDFDAHSNTLDNHLRGGNWVEYEELFLRELVSRYKSGSKGKRVVEWSSVARELRRNELDCKVKWNALCNAARTRKGPYKVEEDQLIIAKVQEYLTSSGACSGSNSGNSSSSGDSSGVSSELWEGLEKTMGRPAKNIRLRWKITLSKRVAAASSSVR